MRERFQIHGHDQLRRVVLYIAAVILALAPLAVPTLLPEQLGAEPLIRESDEITEAENEPAEIQLATGVPESTTAPILKRDSAKLTWLPTGVAGVQDEYDVTITQSNDVDDQGVPSSEVILDGNKIIGPEFSVSHLPDGAYFWQVRACGAMGVCSAWSDPTAVQIDGVAPMISAAAVTSGTHSNTVTIQGASEALVAISLNANEAPCNTTADSDGMWSCTYEQPFEYGEHGALITATDSVGNSSEAFSLKFAVKELFVATQIVATDLPEVLNIVPVDDSPENMVLKQPASVADAIGKEIRFSDTVIDAAKVTEPSITTEGGIVQSSENGWQVAGLPWFIWLGSIGGIIGGWRAFGSPIPRGIGSLFSL